MEAKELRIGNYVYWQNSETDLYTNDLPIEDADDLCDIYYGKKVKPIPLTEEWLKKFGFEKLPNTFSLGRIRITKQDDTDYWFTAFNANDAHINKIKHVHQLQNLYFELTGEELTWNA